MTAKKWRILLAMGVLLVAVAVVGVLSAKDYRVDTADSFAPYAGAPDLYSAERESLDKGGYAGAFGPVEGEEAAARIADRVIREVYGRGEAPYAVKYNETAGAWVVRGRARLLHLGGAAAVAIGAERGEVLMVLHMK